MVGAPGSVLMGGAAKFRHGDEHDIFSTVAHILPEGSDTLAEVGEAAGQLTSGGALVLVRIPPADIGKSSLDAKIGLHQLCNLLHAVAKLARGILHTLRWNVVCRVGRLQHLDCFEGLIPGPVQDSID